MVRNTALFGKIVRNTVLIEEIIVVEKLESWKLYEIPKNGKYEN